MVKNIANQTRISDLLDFDLDFLLPPHDLDLLLPQLLVELPLDLLQRLLLRLLHRDQLLVAAPLERLDL